MLACKKMLINNSSVIRKQNVLSITFTLLFSVPLLVQAEERQVLNATEAEQFRSWVRAVSIDLTEEKNRKNIYQRWGVQNRDCAGLVRYIVWEASQKHSPAFRRQFSGTEMGRTENMTVSLSLIDEKNRKTTYVDAHSLMSYNSTFLTRSATEPLLKDGDLLFFRTAGGYHTMILLRDRVHGKWLVNYHDGGRPGNIKMLYLDDLKQHPQTTWHPVAENPAFLGFYRLNFLL